MKEKETIYKITIPIYGQSVYVVFTDSIAKSRNKRSENLGPAQLDGDYLGGMCSAENGWFYLFFRKDSDDGVIVHETFHMAHRVLERIGVHFNTDNHEPFAYLQEFLFKFVKDCACKKIKKKVIVSL